jgi:hypothetical protein
MAIFLYFNACIQRVHFNPRIQRAESVCRAHQTKIRIPLINSAPGKNCLAGK